MARTPYRLNEDSTDDAAMAVDTHADPQLRFDAIYTLFNPALRQFLAARYRSKNVDFEAVQQEVWMKIARKLHTFQDPVPTASISDRWRCLSGWAFRIAHTTMIDHVRAAAARPQSVASIERARQTPDSVTWERIERNAVANGADIDGLSNVGVELIQQALEQVRATRPEYADILIRFARGQRPYELLGHHGATRSAVKSRAIRARRMFRAILAQLQGDHHA